MKTHTKRLLSGAGALGLGLASLVNSESALAQPSGHYKAEQAYESVGYVSLAEAMTRPAPAPQTFNYEDLGATFRIVLEYQELVARFREEQLAKLRAEPMPVIDKSVKWRDEYGATGYISMARYLTEAPRAYMDPEHGYNDAGYNIEQFQFVK